MILTAFITLQSSGMWNKEIYVDTEAKRSVEKSKGMNYVKMTKAETGNF